MGFSIMNIILTEIERSFFWATINTIWQDYNQRTLYGETIIKSLLDKLNSTEVTMSEVDNRLAQFLMHDRAEQLARLTDPRLQHILQEQCNQGFGAPGSTGSPPGSTKLISDGNCGNHFFHSGLQYWLCQSIVRKLKGRVS